MFGKKKEDDSLGKPSGKKIVITLEITERENGNSVHSYAEGEASQTMLTQAYFHLDRIKAELFKEITADEISKNNSRWKNREDW